MIRIAITETAYDAIAATLPLGSVGYEAERTKIGKVDRASVNRLERPRQRDKDLSDLGRAGGGSRPMPA
jgi:hypothetical protein